MPTTFSIRSLGCKVNQYESQQVRQLLQHRGLQPAARNQQPDLIVLHTCCVTANASAKSRQSIHRLQKQHPHATVVVCGCLPSIETPELSGLTDNVLIVQDRETLAAELGKLARPTASNRLEEGATKHPCVTIKPDPGLQIKNEPTLKSLILPILTRYSGHTRAFLKVQDGCDAHCAYCIIPSVRPRLSSKSLDLALHEARCLLNAGHKEIVLTGVFLGAYGHETTRRQQWHTPPIPPLCTLLDQLAALPGRPRIRLSSLEPADVTPTLIETMARHKNIMPHLHLSLQSGSDTVLQRMGRRYTTTDIRRVVSALRQSLDRPALTTDIIVGFPGETDDEFAQTLDLARDIGFAKIHVFAFSPRIGTAAARMTNQVHNPTIKNRSERLRTLNRELGQTYRNQFLGQTAQVLIESDGRIPAGYSERYFKVYLSDASPNPRKNDLLTVRLQDHYRDGLKAIPIREPLPNV